MTDVVPSAWFVWRSGPGAPDWNMALDEALLTEAASLGRPLLRFYGWSTPAATFGYSQRHADVAAKTSIRPLIRRPTGGGLVPHVADWTYSLILPRGETWYALHARVSYARIHAWVRDAFRACGIPATLAAKARRDAPGECFVGAEEADVLVNGRKVAGAAQRRNRHGLLIQGSVQPPPSAPPRETFETAMLEAATQQWGCAWIPLTAAARVDRRAAQLQQAKYGRLDYHQQR